MKILLTGHKGFLGTLLTKYLNTHGHVVIGLDKKERNNLLTCKLDWDIDIVIHLAGESGVRRSLTQPKIYWENNVLASKRLFDTHKDKKIIYASSSTAKEPERNPYALSKQIVEEMAPKNSIGLRFTTIVGGVGREDMFIPKLIRNEVKYANNHYRDFIHAKDVMEAIRILIDTDVDVRGVIDLGTGKSTSIRELAKRFCANYVETVGDKHERIDNKSNPKELWALGWRSKIDIIDYISQEKNLTNDENLNIM